MNRLYYDLHLHSCLSPCGDDDNTPSTIAGIGVLNGLGLMALTDHNSCANCPAFFEAAEHYGLIPVAGMELETAEEIHVVCLFETLEAAMEFDKAVAARRFPIKNKPELYGNQLIVDCEDNELGRDPLLLVCATSITLDEVYDMVTAHGGVCYPAHIDRQSNGILAILGDYPPDAPFTCVELRDITKADELRAKHPSLSGLAMLTSSDAHRFDDIRNVTEIEGALNYIDFTADVSDADAVRKELIARIKACTL